MIDYSNEVFNAAALHLRSLYPGIKVVGEYVNMPTTFPTVTIDEVENTPAHLDSATTNKYARIQYRVQVYCNGEGKRATARKIYATVDELFMGLGLYARTYTTTPAIYNADVYCITVYYSGVIGCDGVIYRG